MKYLKLFEDDIVDPFDEKGWDIQEGPIKIKDIKELKLGDGVMCDNVGMGNWYIRENKEGTVVDIKLKSQEVGVDFHDYINGHNCDDDGKDGHCWYVGISVGQMNSDYNIRKI